jgi:hypothetical protein
VAGSRLAKFPPPKELTTDETALPALDDAHPLSAEGSVSAPLVQ